MSSPITNPSPNTPSRPRVPAESMTLPLSVDQPTESHRASSSSTSGHDQSRSTDSHWESVIDRATD
jgi:hypothetical protein